MPSDGRNYQTLFALSPGVNYTENPQYPREQDNISNQVHITGIPQATAQENLDGGTNDTANGWAASNVPLDTISEFKIVLNPYDASYGRAGGGAIDVAPKSGPTAFMAQSTSSHAVPGLMPRITHTITSGRLYTLHKVMLPLCFLYWPLVWLIFHILKMLNHLGMEQMVNRFSRGHLLGMFTRGTLRGRHDGLREPLYSD